MKRSVRVAGHRTSLSLEPQFWEALQSAAKTRSVSISSLIAQIDYGRGEINLSSAIRIFLLQEARHGRLAL
ncbi:MAG TPA: ribbon-helix-helix domain-containing protein [Aestuariivirgaceae bacterium]